RDEGDLDRIKMQYGEEYIQSLVKSPVGSGMVQNGAWNRGKPYYVTFRPILHSVVRLTDEDLDKYNHFNQIVEQLEYELEQLEGLKQDVFDLKLELKLAKDKIKSGNFNMVQIYLDGLTPRIQKMWDKTGQKPKKLEIKLLDASAIEEAVAKAKEEKAKKAKEESAKPAQPAEPEEKKELTPAQIAQYESQITELQGQVDTALQRGDKTAAKELFEEIPKIVAKLPEAKKKQWQPKTDALQKRMTG
ncbi:hypothetical protein KY363_03505, partial [Candidatus Woesearchaeota archaeon]|nr:hypothetical protein [Candidatus Woesearchaeota archaeon]